MSNTNSQILLKVSKGPAHIKLSEVFRVLFTLKEVEKKVKDFSIFEASLHQVFVQINA